MNRDFASLVSATCLAASSWLVSGCGSDAHFAPPAARLQAPVLAGAAQPIAASDRVYTAARLGALYNEQVSTHGLGFSADGRLLAAVNVTRNSVSVIETATNTVRGTVYLKRAPHEAFFSPDGTELWVAVRGEQHVAVIEVATLKVRFEVKPSDGAAMVFFRPDGAVAFVNSSRTAELTVIDVKTHAVVRGVTGLVSPCSPNLAASPDGKEACLTHKDVGKVTIVDAQSFAILGVLDTGPGTNPVNFGSPAQGGFAYVTVGGSNEVKVHARSSGTPSLVATIGTRADPHRLWPSPDNSRVHGANAVPSGDGRAGLTQQNVGLRITANSVAVAGGGEADLVVRELQGVDSIGVDAKGLAAGKTQPVIATGAAGTRQVVADFKADADGKGMVNPMRKFFDAGLNGVLVIAAN